jgi:hypothetical protein
MKWVIGEEILEPVMVFTKSLHTAMKYAGYNFSILVFGMVYKHLHSACQCFTSPSQSRDCELDSSIYEDISCLDTWHYRGSILYLCSRVRYSYFVWAREPNHHVVLSNENSILKLRFRCG